MQPGKFSSAKRKFLFLLEEKKKLKTLRKHERHNMAIIVSSDLYVMKPLGRKVLLAQPKQVAGQRKGFVLFLISSLKQGSINYGPQVISSPAHIFVNKILLSHHHAHSFLYYLWLPLCYNDKQVFGTEK